MVKLTRIYTRGGDKGKTSLIDGSRVAKDDPRIEAGGAIDELNATIGVARLHASPNVDAMLARIQHDLFDLGADLSMPDDSKRQAGALRIVAPQVKRLEQEIDALNADLKPLELFRATGWHGLLDLSPCRPHGGTPRGAHRGHIVERHRGQSRGAQIFEPPVGSSLRAGAPRQR